MTDQRPDLLSFFDQLARLAARETLPRFRTALNVTDKGATKGAAYDPVTEADQQAERVLREAILHAFPEDSILGEEYGVTEGTSEWRWVIDPVDGTRAFVCGVPVWTTLIGLEYQGKSVGGLVSQPYLDEHWIATPEQPTQFRRGEAPFSSSYVSGETALANARIMVTDVRAGEYFSAEESLAIITLTKACRLCRQGLDGYGFALVSSGQMDLVVEAGLSWHDIAAVIPVVTAAGGVAVTWSGAPVTPDFSRGRVILAASQALADQAVAHLRDVPLPP